MSLYPSNADPPLGLAGRLHSLNETLGSLASRLRDSIAAAVGGAIADAIRHLVRTLLGEQDRRPRDSDTFAERFERDDRFGFADNRDSDDLDREDPGDEPWQHRRHDPSQPPRQAAAPEQSRRWGHALRAAVQAGLLWLRRGPCRRPVLTTTLVALAAGGTALVAGPGIAACLSLVASTANLLLTADSTVAVAELLACIGG